MKDHVITSPHLLAAAGVEISSQENYILWALFEPFHLKTKAGVSNFLLLFFKFNSVSSNWSSFFTNTISQKRGIPMCDGGDWIALSKSLKFFVPSTTKNTHSVLKKHEIPLLTCTAYIYSYINYVIKISLHHFCWYFRRNFFVKFSSVPAVLKSENACT